ncbi:MULTISPECIES: hypothetical protein [Corynebacterium]|uniref:hypothetical protein n=1 Tax=Corynebacterium TaxID=1716 RepID=UPI00124E2CF1|nr:MULTISPECIES: hypothetical protein [Corynebacterium]
MTTHYEITDETAYLRDELLYIGGQIADMSAEDREEAIKVHRIRATRDLPHHGVKAGDLGGWIESAENLLGEAWVADNAVIAEEATADDKALVRDGAIMIGRAGACGSATVRDNAVLQDDASAEDQSTVGGGAHLYEQAAGRDHAEIRGWMYGGMYFGGMHLDDGERVEAYDDWMRIYEGEMQTGSINLRDAAHYELTDGDNLLDGASVEELKEQLFFWHDADWNAVKDEVMESLELDAADELDELDEEELIVEIAAVLWGVDSSGVELKGYRPRW